MAPLFVPEPEWSPRSWATSHHRYVRGQIDHGMKEVGYDSEPAAAVANLTALDRGPGAYDDRYGFRDPVDTPTGRVGDFVLALEQGVVAAALAQRLRPGLLQRPFRTGGFRSRVKPLLAKERFSI